MARKIPSVSWRREEVPLTRIWGLIEMPRRTLPSPDVRNQSVGSVTSRFRAAVAVIQIKYRPAIPYSRIRQNNGFVEEPRVGCSNSGRALCAGDSLQLGEHKEIRSEML
jgi:hypothetical protein